MKYKLISALLLLFSCVFTVSGHAEENDFEKVCMYFQQLGKLPNIDTMTNQQRNNFIMDNITQNLKSDSDARVAWEAIAYVEAGERYDLFKSAAESVGSSKWQCTAMKDLAMKTGAF